MPTSNYVDQTGNWEEACMHWDTDVGASDECVC